MKQPKRLTLTVPPKSGPTPQGLNVPLKEVKVVRSGKKQTQRS